MQDSNYTYKSGLGHTAAFQAAGSPHITSGSINPSSMVELKFPSVTRSITFNLLDGNATVGFHPFAPQTNCIMVKGMVQGIPFVFKPFTLELKCRRVYIFNNSTTNAADYEVLAELTGIEEEYDLTGSGITGP